MADKLGYFIPFILIQKQGGIGWLLLTKQKLKIF